MCEQSVENRFVCMVLSYVVSLIAFVEERFEETTIGMDAGEMDIAVVERESGN